MKDESSDIRPPAAIVLAAFGTASEEGRTVFDYILARARRRYPRHRVLLAFTSRTVVDGLKGRGIDCLHLSDVPAQLTFLGYRQAAFQPLLILPGLQDDTIRRMPMDDLQTACGLPLLSGPDDLDAVLAALTAEIIPGQQTVFVLHGSTHSPEMEKAWFDLTEALERRFPGSVACMIEGDGPEKFNRLGEQNRVHFVPMTLTAGKHMEKDVLGDDFDSWKNRIGASRVTCAPPLGCNSAILDIFFRHLDQALASLILREAKQE
ncbi:MAG: sirohydrochlorin cobaltochelatase [Syntrophotaleaceae bacterium]